MHCLAVSSCCGFSLKAGTRFIALASLRVSLVMVCVYASLVVGIANHINEGTSTEIPEDSSTSPDESSTPATTPSTTTTTPSTTTTTPSTTTTTPSTTTTTPSTITTIPSTTTTTPSTTTTTQSTTSSATTTTTTTTITTASTATITTTTTTTTTTIITNLKQDMITPSPKTDTRQDEVFSRKKRSDGSESSSFSPEVPYKKHGWHTLGLARPHKKNLLMIYTVAMVMYVVEVVASSLLIHGVHKENASLMCLWLIWEGILVVFNVVELVRTTYQQETEGAGHFVQVGVQAYFWLVVMSYRLTVVEARGYQLDGGRKVSYQEMQNMDSTSDSSSG